jgi:hypothetical protein
MRAAGVAGQRDAALGVKLFDEIAADPSIDPALRDAAALRAAYLLPAGTALAEYQRRLDSLAAAGQGYRSSARELLGVKALEAGDDAAAAKYLDMIVIDSDAPAGLRQRAELLLGLVRSGKPTQG